MIGVNNVDKNRLYILLLIILSAVSAFYIVTHICLSSDSLRYGLVAKEILKGNGIKVPHLWFNSSFIFINGSAYFTEQPPLFPALLAMFGGISFDDYLPAQVINFSSYLISVVVSYLILSQFLSNKFLVFISSFVIFTSFYVLRLTSSIRTEPLFIAFSLIWL